MACGSDEVVDDLPFGNDGEIVEAEELFSQARDQNYSKLTNSNWQLFPTTTNPVASDAPHGAGFASIFVNSTFAKSADKSNPDVGSVIIKNNLDSEVLTDIDSITMMVKKEDGYDPEHHNWFWAKLDPQGNVAANPMGVMLAGRVGTTEGEGAACLGCHQQDSSDFIITEIGE